MASDACARSVAGGDADKAAHGGQQRGAGWGGWLGFSPPCAGARGLASNTSTACRLHTGGLEQLGGPEALAQLRRRPGQAFRVERRDARVGVLMAVPHRSAWTARPAAALRLLARGSDPPAIWKPPEGVRWTS